MKAEGVNENWKLQGQRRHSLVFVWQLQGAESSLSAGCKGKNFNRFFYWKDCPEEWTGSRAHKFIQLFDCKSDGKNSSFFSFDFNRRRLWDYRIISHGEQVTATGPLWSLLFWSGFTLATQAWQTHIPILATCSNSTSLTHVFIFRCSLWNVLLSAFQMSITRDWCQSAEDFPPAI